MSTEIEDAREFWNRVADDWQTQVGRDGDANRRLNSDPVLWSFAGDVQGLKVLDAGCGTGYLSIKLAERGALVTGIDFSERMIAIARATDPTTDFRVDSCSELSTIEDDAFDMVVANYVLMDTPDLEGTIVAFHRVLKPGGVAVLIFSHPCFRQDAPQCRGIAPVPPTSGTFRTSSDRNASTHLGRTSRRNSPGFIVPCRTTGKCSSWPVSPS